MRPPLAPLALFLLLAACGGGGGDAPPLDDDRPMGMALWGQDCAVRLEGVDEVRVEDTAGGARIVLLGDDPGLVTRVERLADMLVVHSARTGAQADEGAAGSRNPLLGPSEEAGTTAEGTIQPGTAQPGVEPSASTQPDAMPPPDAGSMGQEGGTIGAGNTRTAPHGILPPGGQRGPGGEARGAREHQRMRAFPTVWADAEPVEGGAALALTARGEASAADVQEQARALAARVEAGKCPVARSGDDAG